MAFASGGLFGRGVGNSTMKYHYLPEAHNDYILAIIGEELGFVGTLLFFAVFMLMIYAGFKIAERCPSMQGRLIAYGCSIVLVLQFFVNALGILGVTPMTGKTLPFISYGGSSMMASLILAGLIVRVSVESNPRTVHDARRDDFAVIADGGDVSGHIGRSTAGTPRVRSSRTAPADARRRAPERGGFSVMDGGARPGAAERPVRGPRRAVRQRKGGTSASTSTIIHPSASARGVRASSRTRDATRAAAAGAGARRVPAETEGVAMTDKLSIAIAAGGTAGHVNPALALAEELRERGHRVRFFGETRRLEGRLVPEAGFDFFPVRVTGFDRSRPWTLVTALAHLAREEGRLAKAFRSDPDLMPDVAIGFGAYVELPLLRAAAKLGVPVACTSRTPCPASPTSSPPSQPRSSRSRSRASSRSSAPAAATSARIVATGNPVRRSVLAGDRSRGRAALGVSDDETLLLVFGGSLGASHLNTRLAELKERLLAIPGLRIVHSTGAR